MPGLPRAVDWSHPDVVQHVVNELLPLALACFLLGAVETAAIGRMFAEKHGGRFDSNQEFLALAAANLAAGLGRGYPVSGGMSQSLVNEAGRRANTAVELHRRSGDPGRGGLLLASAARPCRSRCSPPSC